METQRSPRPRPLGSPVARCYASTRNSLALHASV
uniref:Uncharacterized protein n=1 Tax=Arundo donax TaxID=35708 RepID=A0A0A8YRB3_ARUDO